MNNLRRAGWGVGVSVLKKKFTCPSTPNITALYLKVTVQAV